MENLLNYIISILYSKFLKSIPSKILLFLGLIASILSIIFNGNYKDVLSQLVVYLFFASIVNCMIYGGCNIGAWLLILVPLLGCIILILDKLGYFKNLKIKLKKSLIFIKT